ncbi:MAG: DUF456 domain-containing protein [Gemmatimonadota bacterium]|nr:DUF456 domain-containing protein [Candidatus Palauibacterales bacterium]
MAEALPLILLIVAFLVGLVLVPFGLPGLWLMVLALIGYAALTGFERVSVLTLVVVVLIAVAGEVLEAFVGFGMAKKFGGSSRAGWGALVGGLIGAVVGTPVPVLGNLVGAFLGAFIGAAAFEATRQGEVGKSLVAGWGAVLGKAAASAIKVALGLTIGVIGVYSALG